MELIPGKNIGIIAAQSIASGLTQSMLNAFHSCGANSKIMTTGVPRLTELIGLSQKPAIVNHTITLRSKGNDENLNCFKYLNINELIVEFDVDKTPHWVKFYSDTTINSGVIIKLDWKTIVKFQLDIEKIKQILFEDENWTAITNPYFEIFAYNTDPSIYITYLYETLTEIKNVNICGLYGISFADFENEEKTIIGTVASCETKFLKILNVPIVDPLNTWSNNVWDIYNTLGIEATRNFLIKEFRQILGPNIKQIHIELIVNKMTWYGNCSSISRYSLRNDHSAVFTRASFEETMLNFSNAILRGEKDYLKEVSSAIIAGQRGNFGTGFFDLLV